MPEEFASYSFLAIAVAGFVLLCSGLLALTFCWPVLRVRLTRLLVGLASGPVRSGGLCALRNGGMVKGRRAIALGASERNV